MTFYDDRTDLCSCQKPAEAWGKFGFHFSVWDEAYIERRILSDPKLRPYWSSGSVSDEELRNRLTNEKDPVREKHIREILRARNEQRGFLRNYLGSSYIYEECERYVAAREANASQAKERDAMKNIRQSAGVRLR